MWIAFTAIIKESMHKGAELTITIFPREWDAHHPQSSVNQHFLLLMVGLLCFYLKFIFIVPPEILLHNLLDRMSRTCHRMKTESETFLYTLLG